MNDLIASPDMARKWNDEQNQLLKSIFKHKINGSFLIKIKSMVLKQIGRDLLSYYSLRLDPTVMATGISEAPEYDICRMIVGVHRHHSIFLSDEQIRNNQKDQNYQTLIVNEVIEKIRLRGHGSAFFRGRQFLTGDEFLYFPVPYTLFVMSTKSLMASSRDTNPLSFSYHSIVSNALSALTLMESNLLSYAYPLCRGMIEQYLKTQMLCKYPDAKDAYLTFSKYEITQSCCSQQYPKEFDEQYDSRLLKSAKSKVDYLHYGWLDVVEAYTTTTRTRYTIYGILEHLKNIASEEDRLTLNRISRLYQMCHGYTHGSTVHVRYPLLQYFEISTMLYDVMRSVYIDLHKLPDSTLCEEDAKLISVLDRDFSLLDEQYGRRSTENFDDYYAYHK